MGEVLPQDIISGNKYYVEYWGRVNDYGITDPTKPHVLLKRYFGRIDEEDHGVFSFRDAVEIQDDGELTPQVNDPFFVVKPEIPMTIEEHKQKHERSNYYKKIFHYNKKLETYAIQNRPLQQNIPSLQTLAYQQLSTSDLDKVRNYGDFMNMYNTRENRKLGGKKRKIRKSKKTKRSKKSLIKSKKKRSKT